MSGINDIFYKRLERIREELDLYINRSYCKEVRSQENRAESNRETTRTDGLASKFLQYMRLNDYVDEDDYFADEESPVEKSISTDVPKRKSYSVSKRSAVDKSETKAPDKSVLSPNTYPEIDRILEKRQESFPTMLLRLIDEKRLKDSDVYKNANIDRRLFSKIRSDENYIPSKKTAISFCLALQLTLEEAKQLLGAAGYSFSEASRFDLIIMYLIENCEFNIHFANIVLDDYGEGSLSR